VIGLIVGKAMSGAFLAHGYQANRLIAINDKGVLVHAMGKASAARITLRTVEALEKLAATIPHGLRRQQLRHARSALRPAQSQQSGCPV
jgi:biotin-independent malonate decarboxylase gamma subunit